MRHSSGVDGLGRFVKKVNYLDLVRKVKSEQKREKKISTLITVGSLSLIAISGLIISL